MTMTKQIKKVVFVSFIYYLTGCLAGMPSIPFFVAFCAKLHFRYNGGRSTLYCLCCSRYSVGDIPTAFLKQRVKYFGSVKPTE